MKRSHIGNLLATIRALPPFPSGVSRLMTLSQADPGYFEDASAIIRADPALAGQVVRIANSALYAGQARVEDLDRAIMRVGIRMVVASLTSVHLRRTFDPVRPGMASVWLDNVLAALVCRSLVEQSKKGEVTPESAYTCGLLHDVGRLVLVVLYPRGMESLSDRRLCPLTELVPREHAVFGVSHSLAGRLLANRWNFPPEMTSVIAIHHVPADQRPELPRHLHHMTDLVLLSDLVTYLLDDAPGLDAAAADRVREGSASGAGRALMDRLGVDQDTLLLATGAALDQMERQRAILGLSPARANMPA